MTQSVSIIDYGMSNLLSITRAFEHVGAQVSIVSHADEIMKADFLVLPGVGAFPDGMEHLESRQLADAIKAFTKTGKPLMGICLGMQMLLSKGYEHSVTDGLNIIEGEVLPLPKDMPGFKVPNINWHSIYPPDENKWNQTILHKSKPETCFYFVHSYFAKTKHAEDVLAYSKFGHLEFAAAIIHENVVGTQFHPEKSGEDGLVLLKQFIQL
ncbi:MAG: imidazole glycerol phosphate synthase subunit HisH [Bacteroidetes bacterium]|nr:imidazole glycerol phosphate synthase subunit HisH [Bacteroidota bacterium]